MLLRSLALVAFFACTPVWAETAVPPLRAPVTDLTGTLSPSEVSALDRTLRAAEERKGAQVAVLLVPTTGQESIEDYSMRVVESWKLGRGDVDDGVLFLVAKDDRQMRIEVGYGLEGALPDAIAKRIIRDVVTPHFRRGEFYLGIVAGVDRIVRSIEGEPLPEPALAHRLREPGSGLGSLVPVLLVATLVVGGILRAIFGRFGGALVAAAGAGLLVWLLAGALLVALVAALLAFFFTLVGAMSGTGGRRSRGWGGVPFPVPRGGGGFGGGWGGGGGGFGGGGASGRW